ncbi:TRAP transporter substrate-binding protein DctP [Orrella daihaiensis]|uniref:TRAP transporter substrate-binding protein DctP n=1 Tax=Orrella daihaiensis TaxID=2782176 RepID=A0ABY4ALB2_9BURK|nr:TRAP transporter substrate-binding protein DctP [Orrella daihaiensis]UOD49885.1 TRAP transporter substrate-binding protein DctP [Orrella daihaiensis]
MTLNKKLLASALAMTFTAVGFSASAANVDGPEVEWRYSMWGNPRAFTAGIEHLAKRVSEETGGKFTITIGYGEQFSKARENLDAIKLGAVDGASFCNFYHPGKNPAFMVFSLPFLPLGDWDVNKQARMKLHEHPALVADMDRWNAMVYAAAMMPQYEFLGNGKPPKNLEDWKGMRVRAGGGIGDAMEKLGAIKTTTTATEVYTSMQRGSMDAASFPYTYAQAAYKIPEVSKWYTTNMSPGTSSCPTVFSKTSYEKLPPQYKKLLEDLKPEVYDVQIKAYQDIDKVNLPKFAATLEGIVYTPEQLEQFRAVAAKPVWDEWVAENKDKFDGQELINIILETAKQKN